MSSRWFPIEGSATGEACGKVLVRMQFTYDDGAPIGRLVHVTEPPAPAAAAPVQRVAPDVVPAGLAQIPAIDDSLEAHEVL